MQSPLALAKKVYVPAPHRPKKPEPRARLPSDLAAQPAGLAFRAIRWDPTAPVEAPAPALPHHVVPLDPTVSARVVFAGIPWSGEASAAPTATQSESSVVNVLSRFKWE